MIYPPLEAFRFSLLLLLLAFCLLASLFDLRRRVVPDWLNATFFAVALSMAFFLRAGLIQQLLFVAFCFAFAFVLYKLGAWAGGDAKFFTALLAFYPLFKPLDYAAPLHVFLTAVLFLAPFILFSHWREIKREKQMLKALAVKAIGSAVGAVAFAFVLSIAFKRIAWIGLFWSFVISALAFFAFTALPELMRKALRKQVAIAQLQDGAIPAETIVVARGKWKAVELGLLQAAKKLASGKRLFEGKVVANAFLARGLEKSEIVELKKLRGLRFLQVRESLAFAPMLSMAFFAVVLL